MSCEGGHMFTWGTGTGEPLPEGLLCQCGQTIAHWETCDKCGTRILKPLPTPPAPGYLDNPDSLGDTVTLNTEHKWRKCGISTKGR